MDIDVIHNKEDRKRFCDSFTGGRMCQVIGLIVPKFFCVKVCHGRPEEVNFPPEIKRNIERYQQRQMINLQGQSAPELTPIKSFRDYCLTCPGPSGRHQDERDTFFRACSVCLLLGIKPDGTRQNLQEWWASGGACPLGHWPPKEKRWPETQPPGSNLSK
ncbi:MAG TPA: hypothetical protein PKY88_13150 [Anaerohalosphaeraceae bacterium]|nr:hypothetical protein [Anaerohalosphaeraceae bacterium]